MTGIGRLRGALVALVMFSLLSAVMVAVAWAAAPGGAEAEKSLGAIPWIWWVAPAGAILALVFAWHFYRTMMRASEGTDEMAEIAGHVRAGAMAYIWQQYKVVAIVFVLAVGVLSVVAYVAKAQHGVVPFAFLTGGFFSGLCGYLGMRTATNASARTANGAKQSLNRGLQIAFRSGAVMGLVVVGLGLFDICAWFLVLHLCGMELHKITVVMLCFGMGASTQALFARVGGGIFTKAADVGADLVGKVEAGIPEDDPRNPATIADNVGDNVGDVAGMGADLYESYCGSILASAALGVAAGLGIAAAVLPMVIAGIGIVLSVIGIYAVRTGEEASQRQLLKALARGVNLSSVLIVFASGGICYLLLGNVPKEKLGALGWAGPWLSVVAGLVAGVVIGKSTEYYTASEFKPTRGIAEQAATGPATVIIEGMAVGMRSVWIPVITIGAATMLAYVFAGGTTNPALGLFGVGIAAVGMLSTLGLTLATDAYGPIADNAGGNAEMTGQEPFVRERTDALDSLGNTTAATGKGFAIGSAALTALALMAAYVEEVRLGLVRVAEYAADKVAYIPGVSGGLTIEALKKADMAQYMQWYNVTLMNPKVLVGMFIGSMMAFLFCSMTMKAVGRAAGAMVEEVRRQFREKPGIMDGKEKPDYAECVEISTRGAQREMIIPSVIALVAPVAAGAMLGVAGVLGLLAGGLVTGFVLAVMMANAGGAWDNAKKYIESGNLGGKGSDNHKATVVGDTVGDPFKDTSGPSLNILIKLMAMVSVVFAGFVVKFSPIVMQWLRLDF